MRLLSVTLRNYRLHRELKVDFDPARTLIGGPNETGKSTLIEAVHRALFLKAKGNTEHHRAMVSARHPGHPEVELSFEVGGNPYCLKKRFGTNGTTTLAPANSVSLSGEAAESELARLLGVEAGVTGKAVVNQWAHLWVWQGEAGDNPAAHATAQHDGLLQRVQPGGGGAALQSERDGRVATFFAEAKDQIYIRSEKPKAGSELERAVSAHAVAQEELALARDRVRKLDSAAADLESASGNFCTAGTSLVELERQQGETESRARKLGELRQQEAEQAPAANAAADQHQALGLADREIRTARVDISAREERLKPQNEAAVQLENASHEAKGRAASAEQAWRTAIEAVRTARFRQDLAAAHALRFEKAEIHSKLSGKAEKVAHRRRDLALLAGLVAKLPQVDKARLNKLQKLESECSHARAALQAMATGFEVVISPEPVNAGGQTIPVGQLHILTEDTEVQIGAVIRLRIQPGGGTNLAEARRKAAEAQKQLQAVLDSVGLRSVPEAVETYARCDELGSRIKSAQAELEGLGAGNLAEELSAAQTDLVAVEAKVERLVLLAPDVETPGDRRSADALTKALVGELSKAEDRETEAKARRDQLVEALESATEVLKGKKAEVEQQGNQLTGLKAQLDLLLEMHGDDRTRPEALTRLQAAKAASANRLQVTRAAITSLQPDLLEADRARIARSIKERTAERIDAGKQIAVAQAILRPDGSEDPLVGLATAEARVRSAREHQDSVQRHAHAIALLDRLFREEQRTLSEQFSRPLADKITGYLQCLFGAAAHAQVDLEEKEFTGLRLSRPGYGDGPFAFDELSGGAREQTAAAVRLAMAEVLAADHDGCLPVVFDDAFAYSDPERVNQLQRMLDLAATRGLQVIVLSCNPADYASLGAKTVTLTKS